MIILWLASSVIWGMSDAMGVPEKEPAVLLVPLVPAEGIQPNPRLIEYVLSHVDRAQDFAERALLRKQLPSYGRSVGTKPTVSELLCRAFFDTPIGPSNQTDPALIALEVTSIFSRLGIRAIDISSTLPFVSLSRCNFKPLTTISSCRRSLKYRKSDGTCNNLEHPTWGTPGQALARVIKPNYGDGVSTPLLVSEDGNRLPSVRKVSKSVTTGRVPKKQLEISSMVPAFSHFIYEDLVELAQSTDGAGNCLDCCGFEINRSECLPFHDDDNDDGSRKSGGSTRCFPYVRLQPGTNEKCSLGPRTPINHATAYLDGSQIYGSSDEDARRLRKFQGGQLQYVMVKNDIVPRLLSQKFSQHRCRSPEFPCFDYGAHSGNFLPETQTIHGIFLRHHNNMAKKLATLNRHWNDERLYQEARKIVVAQVQHIAYQEWIPLLIGQGMTLRFNISDADQGGFFSGYKTSANPQIFTSYAVAVGVFYNSMWGSELLLRRTLRSLDRVRCFYNSEKLLTPGVGDLITEALLTEHPNKPGHMEPRFTDEFLKTADSTGTDLLATLIQMGRDAGLASYVHWREYCGLGLITSFTDLGKIMAAEDIERLQSTYRSPKDIDLIIGGLLEVPTVGGLLGSTFACIMATQWQYIRSSDRFYHESFIRPGAFTEDQLSEIKKTTLAYIICENTNLKSVQPSALLAPDNFENYPVNCHTQALPTLDFSKWIDGEAPIKFRISDVTVEKAIDLGRTIALVEAKKEMTMAQKALGRLNPLSAGVSANRLQRPSAISLKIHKTSMVLMDATMILTKTEADDNQNKLDRDSLMKHLPYVDISRVVHKLPSDKCLIRPVPCDHTAKYRTVSGWCNNLKFPEYGSSFRVFRRLVQPEYNDGFSTPRQYSATGVKLPNPRLVSTTVHGSITADHPRYSHFLMQWGQFLDHDLSLSPIASAPDGSLLDCSECDSPTTVSPHCWPIRIPKNDPFFPSIEKNGKPRCLNFARSMIGQLNLGYRDQINELTPFIDASNIYGSDDCRAKQMRLFNGGQLKTSKGGLLPLMPEDEECRSPAPHNCFRAGDDRVNEHIGLSSIHTVWVRRHNQIVESLSKLNKHWNDERLFQETRKIIGAMMQQITYNEFLPKVIGQRQMAEWDLHLSPGFAKTYDENCDAAISSVFATVAFRFGHTLVSSMLMKMSPSLELTAAPLLRSKFFEPSELYEPGSLDAFITGLCSQHAQANDRFISPEVRDHLFEELGKKHSGLDLAALNIQRSRDHGLPGYARYRRRVGLFVPKTFGDLAERGIMSNDTIAAIGRVYRSVKDIDAFTAMIAEVPVPGALLGPLGIRLLAEQFQRLKKCDRFWHENPDNPGRFTAGQLEEIKKTTLASVICRTCRLITRLQPNVMAMPDQLQNHLVSCSDLPQLDLTPWLDADYCDYGSNQLGRGTSKNTSPCVSCTCTMEGILCQSTKVVNCGSLIKSYSLTQIQDDRACMVQCLPFMPQLARRQEHHNISNKKRR